jgi:hypothetical protein
LKVVNTRDLVSLLGTCIVWWEYESENGR